MPKKHKLGFGNGTIMENEDGTAAYIAPATFSQAFRVKISDVTGFSVSKGSKLMERTLHILGNGTELAKASVNHGVSEKIEAWFRAHPSFGSTAASAPNVTAAMPPVAPAPSAGGSLVEELTKLGQLREVGVLTSEEFEAAKRKLLS
jgi:hypothetical protein